MSKSGEAAAAGKQLGEATLAAMARHAVPATPGNYALWYAHLSGSAPELSRTIELLIAQREPFTEERNADLLRRFGRPDPLLGVLQQTGDDLQKTLSQLLQQIDQATGETREYGARLDSYSSQLSARPGIERLSGIVSGLIAETRRVAERNELLEQQLSQSSGEVRALRRHLATVQREAQTDPLTGIANRKFFEQCLAEAVAACCEAGQPLSLLFIDIDHFKRFNDSYGHQLGDQVLRLVAKTLIDGIKGRDTAARYGGEEFAIILPQTRLGEAVRVADHIRRTMMTHRIVGKASGEDYGHITLSIGVALYVPGEPPAQTMERADAALYVAKRSGRNKVTSEAELAREVAALAGA